MKYEKKRGAAAPLFLWFEKRLVEKKAPVKVKNTIRDIVYYTICLLWL